MVDEGVILEGTRRSNTSVSNLDEFSPDYGTARLRFREAVARLGWGLESYSIDAKGFEFEEGASSAFVIIATSR